MPAPTHERPASITRSKEAGVFFAFACVTVVLMVSGIFTSSDLWLFDRFANLQSRISPAVPDTLVVRFQRELSSAELTLLAEQCQKGNARLTLIFDDRLEITPHTSHLNRTFVIPFADEGEVTEDGIRRGSSMVNQVAVLVSEKLGISPPQGYFNFDFKIPPKGFPVVNYSRVLAGDLPQDLIAGKVVLIGRDHPSDRRIVTPIHRQSNALSPVFFQALVADALLRSAYIRTVPAIYSWGFGALAALALGLYLRIRNLRASPGWYLALVMIILLATEVILFSTNQWLSPVGMWVLLGGVSLAATHSRDVVERDSLRETLRSLAVETRGRTRQTVFSQDFSPWMMVETAFSSAFSGGLGFALAHTNRGLLTPVSDIGREQCTKCFTAGELKPESEPFASALRNGGSEMGQNLVIVPIRTPARLVGFWVFETNDQRTVSEASRYADRMAHYLERRTKKSHHGIPTDGTRPLHDQLTTAIDLLEDSRRVITRALDCSSEAVLVFDSLGVSEHVSRPSLELFANAGIAFEGMRPLELINHLTEVSEEEIRWGLRFVALHRKEVTFLTRQNLIQGRTFFLHLRPLEGSETNDNETGLPGLVILIEDVTEIANSVLVKDEFMERFHFQLNNDFEAILSAAALIADPRISPSEQGELLEVITEKVKEATGLFGETRERLQSKFSPEIVERFPIRFERVFEAARASIEKQAEERQVSLRLSISDYLPLVLASPIALENLIHSILLTLIHNASENTELSVTVTQEEKSISILMKNKGFGMPEKQLRHLLETGAGGWDTLDRIGSARQTVVAWDGELDVSSQVGKGIEFHLKLATVL